MIDIDIDIDIDMEMEMEIRSWFSVSYEHCLLFFFLGGEEETRTIRLEDRFDPPTLASTGADRWIKRNVERNGADAWANLTRTGVDVFLGRSSGFIAIVRSKSSC